jgi:uncharacterized membrane protein YfcA
VSVAEGALLLVTGVVAGVVSVVVSLASLVSYPVLLAVGLSPLSANVTNTVALVFTAIGSAAGSRQELTGQGRLLARLGWLTAVGGAVGAAVLLLTPPGSFEAVVPWLVGGASLVLLVQPTITRRQPVGPSGDPDAGAHGPVMLTALFAVAGYVGYFGAAGGVLMLAVLTPMLRQSAARTIAVKNAISGAANAVAAIGFALFGPVRWSAAAPLAAGFLLGGRLGPAAVRRLPDRGLQVAIGVCGLAMAAKLGMDSYR